ncbi:hypothetical protein [Sphingomonas sp. BAUL-RG-20F-R05-02]|uniref:hypothetical protein n=1 Tax=Sphingomonas sp. BAUL-RG-20F-R05-02 TaxID=2914830 RepID=UPI001F591F1A|nr:hypothetical protein [Sphingomonas sp. BAUL-RG-20F-R05-02]
MVDEESVGVVSIKSKTRFVRFMFHVGSGLVKPLAITFLWKARAGRTIIHAAAGLKRPHCSHAVQRDGERIAIRDGWIMTVASRQSLNYRGMLGARLPGGNTMKNTVERAYELARSGSYPTIKDIERQLTKEQHESVHAHLSGDTLKKQLKALIRERGRQGQAEPQMGTQV